MDILRNRKRGEPVLLGSEPSNGGLITFHLEQGRLLQFISDPGLPLLAFGVEARIAGHVQLTPDFKVHKVQMAIRQYDPHARPKAFDDDDRDTALSTCIERIVTDAATRLMTRESHVLSEAWLTLADDHALGRMSYRQHVLDKRDSLGPDITYKDEWFLSEQVKTAEREVETIDQETYAGAWMHQSRPGYVVVCDGRPVDRGDVRFREDRGTGWLQRHVFIHLASACRFAENISGDDVAVERIRVVRGKPFTVTPDGLAEPSWHLEDPVLTGTIMQP